jgi:Fe(3+) dicitrate transport protein
MRLSLPLVCFFWAIKLVAVFPQTQFNIDSTQQQEIPEVTVVSKKDRLFSGVPGSVFLLNAAQLTRIAPLTGNEVFKKIPGVHVVDEEGLGLRANIGIRGLDPDRSSSVLILEDGIPVQLNPYGEPELYYTPSIDRMSAIEILKGSGQIMFGPRTIGGVINYITADPPQQPETNVTLRGGSGGFLGTQLGYGNTYGNIGIRLQYDHKRADKIGVTGIETHDFNAKLRLILGAKSSLMLKMQWYDEWTNATYLGLNQSMYDQKDYYPNMAPDDQLNVRRYALSTTHKYLIHKRLKLITTGYTYTTDRNWRRQTFSVNPSAPLLTGVVWGDSSIANGAVYMQSQSLHRNRSFRVAGVESHLVWTYNIQKMANQLDVGVRFLREGAMEQELLGSSPQAIAGVLVRNEKRPGSAMSGYVQNKFGLTDRLAVTAGIRLEDYHFERGVYLYKTVSNVYRDTIIAASSHIRALIPGLGLVFQGGKNVVFFLGVHKGIAPPAIKNSVSATGEVFALDTQDSWNYELGTRFNYQKGMAGEFTLFYLDFGKQVIAISESSGGTGSGFSNAGATRHAGLETSFKVDFGTLFEWKYLDYLQSSATFSRATYASDRFVGPKKTNVRENLLPYAPLWMVTQTMGFTLPAHVEIQLSGNYVAPQFTDELNTQLPSADGRSGLIEAYFAADAVVRWGIPAWKSIFTASVKNLTDARYIVSRRPQGIKMGIPRTLIFGITSVF